MKLSRLPVFSFAIFAIAMALLTTEVYADMSDSKLVTEDTKVGSGEEAVAGKNVEVHYTGWLNEDGKKGTKFDSSVDRGQTFSFMLGSGMVIQGWDKGVAGMKEGGKRTLYIPSELGYGARGAGGVIPPNADLIFDVELVNVQ